MMNYATPTANQSLLSQWTPSVERSLLPVVMIIFAGDNANVVFANSGKQAFHAFGLRALWFATCQAATCLMRG